MVADIVQAFGTHLPGLTSFRAALCACLFLNRCLHLPQVPEAPPGWSPGVHLKHGAAHASQSNVSAGPAESRQPAGGAERAWVWQGLHFQRLPARPTRPAPGPLGAARPDPPRKRV